MLFIPTNPVEVSLILSTRGFVAFDVFLVRNVRFAAELPSSVAAILAPGGMVPIGASLPYVPKSMDVDDPVPAALLSKNSMGESPPEAVPCMCSAQTGLDVPMPMLLSEYKLLAVDPPIHCELTRDLA